uniref:MFS domain-containing protein n=1 Tax=Panagrellus redivivus TaxID=6233 RepID=A0A7E4W4R2_PANRE
MAVAALFANCFAAKLIDHFGAHFMFTLAGFLTTVSTAILPIALRLNAVFVIGLRCCQGISFAMTFPMVGNFVSKWAYVKQVGGVMGVLTSFAQLAPAISDPISGALCVGRWGWPSVLYGHAVFSGFVFGIFALTYRNRPADHFFISDAERYLISIRKPLTSPQTHNIPTWDILKTPSVLAIWVAALGTSFNLTTVFLFAPRYLHNVLGMGVSHTGIAVAVSAFSQVLVKIFADNMRIRIFNSLAAYGSSICLIVICLISNSETKHKLANLILLTISTAVIGFDSGGYYRSASVVACQFSHFVIGNVTLCVVITILIVPVIIGGLVPRDTVDEWTKVFWIIAVVQIACNSFFLLFSSADSARWTRFVPRLTRPRVTTIRGTRLSLPV